MELRLKKCAALFIVTVLTSFLTVNVARAVDVDNWSALTNAIQEVTTSQTIIFTGDISGANSLLGNQGADNLTINGGNFTLSGTNGVTSYSGISVDEGKTLTIQNIIDNNDLSLAGAGVSRFSRVNAAGNGGGFISNNGTTNVINSYFENNNAEFGGVINSNATSEGNASKVTITDSIFKSNTAEKSGGVIRFKNSATHDASELTIGTASDNTKFEGNHALYEGGAIYISSFGDSPNTIIGSINADFTDNYVSNDNEDAFGGAISIYTKTGTSDERYTISGDFTGNYAQTTSTNAEQHGAGGGALSIDDEFAYVAVNNSTFEDNYTKAAVDGNSMGGAIFSEADLKITNSTFSNNGKMDGTATTDLGGAIANLGVAEIIDSSFSSNAAKHAGGAITNRGDLTIEAKGKNVIFSGNTANGTSNDIYNIGDLNLKTTDDYTITLGGGITGTTGEGVMGDTIIDGNVIIADTASKIVQNTFTINTGSLKTKAGILNSSIINNAILELTGGTNTSTITGDGILKLTGTVTNSDSITAGSLQMGALSTYASLIGGGSLSLTDEDATSTLTRGVTQGTINNSGTIVVVSGSGGAKLTTTKSLVNSGTIKNETTLDIAGLNNTGSILDNSESVAADGVLSLKGTGTNAGTIEQKVIELNAGSNITNTGTITAYNLTIKGEGALTTGLDNFEITNDFKNDGTLNLTGGTLDVDIIGGGDLYILGNVTNDELAITQGKVIVNAGKTLANAGTITTALTNNGIISETGEIVLNGDSTNSGSITQNSLEIGTDVTLTNTGTIIATTLTNAGNLNMNEGSAITATTLTNTGNLNINDDSAAISQITNTKNVNVNAVYTLSNGITADSYSDTNKVIVANEKTLTTAGQINNQNITLQGTGALEVGANTLADTINSITMDGAGLLNIDNDTIETINLQNFTANNGGKLNFDTDFAQVDQKSDLITIAGNAITRSGANALNLNIIRIKSDLEIGYNASQEITLFDTVGTGNISNLNINGTSASYGANKYTFVQSADDKGTLVVTKTLGLTLPEAIGQQGADFNVTIYNLADDLVLDTEGLGTLTRKTTDTPREFTISGNNYSVDGNGTYGGVIVNTNDILNLENLTDFNDFSGDAVTNAGTLTVNNVTNLGPISGSGTTSIEFGTTNASSITQGILNILEGATLKANASNITISNSITNAGTLIFTGGTNRSVINGGDVVKMAGSELSNYANINAAVKNTTGIWMNYDGVIRGNITNEGNMAIKASDIGGAVINIGNLNIGEGTLEYNITGIDGTTQIEGDVISNALIANNINIFDNKKLTIGAGNVGGDVTNNAGTITLTTGTLASGNSITGDNGTTQVNGTVHANANDLGNEIELLTPESRFTELHLTDGILSKDITGNGWVAINGATGIISDIILDNSFNDGTQTLSFHKTNAEVTIGSDTKSELNFSNYVTLHGKTTFLDGVAGDDRAKINLSGYLTQTAGGSDISAVDVAINKATEFNDGALVLNADTGKDTLTVGNVTFNDGTRISVWKSDETSASHKLTVAEDKKITFENNNSIGGKEGMSLEIIGDVENKGALTLNRNTSLSKGIKGTGNIINNAILTIKGNNTNVISNNATTGKTIFDSATLIINHKTISGNTVENKGMLTNIADISSAITNQEDATWKNENGNLSGTISNKGTMSAEIAHIKNTITNTGTLTLEGGEGSTVINSNSIIGGTGKMFFKKNITNNAAITQGNIFNADEMVNTGVITAMNNFTNNGTLTSVANKIIGSILNNGTYNIQGGTLSHAINGSGTTYLASGNKLTLGSGASFADSQIFNAGYDSTIRLMGAGNATTATINGLTIADDQHMNLEIDWGDVFNSTGAGIDLGKVRLSKIDLTSTGGASTGGNYQVTNLIGKFELADITNLVKTDDSYNSIKYESTTGNLYGSRSNLVTAIAATDSGAVVYAMSGDESAGNNTLGDNMVIQGEGHTIAGGGIIVGDGIAVTNKTLALKDVGIKNVIVGAVQEGAIHVKGANTLEVIADKHDIAMQGTTGGINPNAIYLDKDTTGNANAIIQANSGRKITISDDIRSDDINNKVSFTGAGSIKFDGVFDPATADMSAAELIRGGQDYAIDWNLNAGTLKYTQDSFLGGGTNSMNFNGGSLDMRNGATSAIELSALTLSNDSNLYLDVDLANKTMDNFGATPVTYAGGTLHVAGMNLISDATEALTTINFTSNSNLMGNVDYTGAQNVSALSPIYKYNIGYENTSGNFNFTRSGGYGGYNPAIMASPVAAQVGSYLTQLNNYEQAFANMDMMMLMTQKQRQAMKFANKYASTQGPATGGVITFDPNQIPEQSKGVWFRPFATFENVGLKNGPTVDNVAYGSLFGGDSDLIELSHGWDMVWSAYAGYNGSHQTYDGVGIYQNGGTLGTSAAFFKGNFFTGLTANVGANVGEASTMYGNDTFTMLTTGIASKTGYNFELADGKFIIQPNWFMSYSFINTFNYRNAAGVSIESDPLHAIQIAPGIKFIGNLKNGWQPYASIQMVWNIMDQTKFSANDVSLPELSVKPYIQYGVGLQKRWGDRFTAFGQAMIRNGGRNGIALQFGARWALGKGPVKSKASETKEKIKEAQSMTPQFKNTKLNLSSMHK